MSNDEDFDARLKRARAERGQEHEPKAEQAAEDRGGAMSVGMRIGVDMIASILVSVAIGYFLDRWLGTKPWLMIVFLFLGAMAGGFGVYRAMNGLGDAVGIGRKPPVRKP
jgi:ATP synthase protein I